MEKSKGSNFLDRGKKKRGQATFPESRNYAMDRKEKSRLGEKRDCYRAVGVRQGQNDLRVGSIGAEGADDWGRIDRGS